MHWINASTLKLNTSRGISRISEQGLEPLRRLPNLCLPAFYSKPSGASVTHWWAAVSFQDLTLGWSCLSLCSCICLRVFHVERSIWFIHLKKVGKKIIPVVHWEVSRKGKLSIKEINGVLSAAVHKVLIFRLVLINHNFWKIQIPKKTSCCDSIPHFPLGICHFVTFSLMGKKRELNSS